MILNQEQQLKIDAIMSADKVYVNGTEDFCRISAADRFDIIEKMLMGMQIKLKMRIQSGTTIAVVDTLFY